MATMVKSMALEGIEGFLVEIDHWQCHLAICSIYVP